MDYEANQPQKLDLMNILDRFIRVMKRFWYVAVILALLGGSVSYVRGKNSFRPMYECKVVFSVTSSYGSSDIFSTTYYDNSAAQQLAEAFPNILSTDLMKDLICEELGKSYINGSISASAISNTNKLILSVRSSNAQDAYDILRATIESYPRVAIYMVDNPQAVVLSEPKVPTSPVNQFSWKGPVLKGSAMGLLLACGLGLALTFLNRVVTSAEQLKAITSLPILGSLPQVRQKKRNSGKTVIRNFATDAAMVESLRALSLKLRKTLATSGGKVIALTSSVSGEGKTTVAVQLARTMAEDGRRVLVVDGDLRKQSVANQFGGTASGEGLLECLANDKHDVLSCIKPAGETLDYLSGTSARTSRYTVEYRRLFRVMDLLRKRYDYIILDTPPMGIVADTLIMCQCADITLYVVRPEQSTEPQIVDNVTELYQRHVKVQGFVCNGMPRNRGDHRYGKNYSAAQYYRK